MWNTIAKHIQASPALRHNWGTTRQAIIGPPVSSSVLRRWYHENIVEHYENPRNVGSLDKNDDHVGTVRSNHS